MAVVATRADPTNPRRVVLGRFGTILRWWVHGEPLTAFDADACGRMEQSVEGSISMAEFEQLLDQFLRE